MVAAQPWDVRVVDRIETSLKRWPRGFLGWFVAFVVFAVLLIPLLVMTPIALWRFVRVNLKSPRLK